MMVYGTVTRATCNTWEGWYVMLLCFRMPVCLYLMHLYIFMGFLCVEFRQLHPKNEKVSHQPPVAKEADGE